LPFERVLPDGAPLHGALAAAFLPARGGDADPGAAADALLPLNLLLLALLGAAAFRLAQREGGPAAGLAAAVLATGAPAVLSLARVPRPDLLLAATVAASYVLWEESDRLRRRGPSLALGAVCAAGLLAAPGFALCVAVPVGWSAWRAVRERRAAGAALCLSAAFLGAFPWYASHALPAAFRALLGGGPPPPAASAGGSWPLVLAAAIGLIESARRRRWAPLAWAGVPALAAAFVPGTVGGLAAWPAAAAAAALAPSTWRPRAALAWRAGLIAATAFLAVHHSAPALLPSAARRAASAARLGVPEPPARGQWPVAAILSELRRDGGAPRVALASDDPRFGVEAFRLSRALSGDAGASLSASGGEAEDFTDRVLVRSVGAARAPRGFARERAWPLPDGAEAVLFRPEERGSPWPSALLDAQLSVEEFPAEDFDVRGLTLRLNAEDAAAARRGVFSQIVIECRRLERGGLVLEDVRLDARDVRVDLPRLLGDKELRVRGLGELRPSASVSAGAVRDWLSARAPRLDGLEVDFTDGAARLGGRVGGVPVEARAEVRLSADGDSLDVRLASWRLAGIPLPPRAAGGWARWSLPLGPAPDRPFRISLEGMTMQDGRIVLTGAQAR
jgi:hypothetical protein